MTKLERFKENVFYGFLTVMLIFIAGVAVWITFLR
jgi:hypothetical protein